MILKIQEKRENKITCKIMRKRVKLCKKRKITQIGKKCLSRTTRRYKDVEARAQSRAKKKN